MARYGYTVEDVAVLHCAENSAEGGEGFGDGVEGAGIGCVVAEGGEAAEVVPEVLLVWRAGIRVVMLRWIWDLRLGKELAG